MKTIFITGASSGIGKACAEIFSARKYTIIMVARRKKVLDDIARGLKKKYNNEIVTYELDVSNLKEVKKCVAQMKGRHIDVLINNAGLSLGKEPFQDMEMADIDTMINTNVKGLAYVTKVVLPILLKSGDPYVINIGSIAGINAYEGGNVYCATKAAVKSLSECLRIDLLAHGVRVTNIQPGAVETDFSLIRFKGDKERAKKVYDNFKPLTAENIANMIDYCVHLPLHVNINELTVCATAQANAYYLYKQS